MNNSNLEKRVIEYIDNVLFKFDDFSDKTLDEDNLKEQICSRLFLSKYAGKAQTSEAKEMTKEKVNNIVDKNLPFIFAYCFGGYKHFSSPSSPLIGWAELFNIRYLIEYLMPIINSYKKTTVIEYESEEVALELMNNVSQKGTDLYTKGFRSLISHINKNTNINVELNFLLAKDQYPKEELFKRMQTASKEVKARFDELSEEEKEIRLKRAETNFSWNGLRDLTRMTEKEKRKIVYNSRISNETFLDVDYELRGEGYFEKENLIPLLGTFGYGAGGEYWLHVQSCSSSIVDFWIGTGILEVREDRIIPKILSKKQYEKIKDELIEIKYTNKDTEEISSNYSSIFVYSGKLQI